MSTTTTAYRKVTAYLCAKGAADAIEFYKKAFGAEETFRMEKPDGRIGHAQITIGDTTLMLADEWPEFGVLSPATLKGNSVSLVLDVDDADAAWGRAIGAGVTIQLPLKDEPYGRTGRVIDPFGHRWHITQSNPDFKA